MMIKKSPSPLSGRVRVCFELPPCLWADRVAIAGEFNDWDESATPMRQGDDGVWRAIVDLPCGRQYEFRYVVDGEWMTDLHADGFATNSYGTDNSIIRAELPEETLVVHRAASSVHNGFKQHGAARPAYRPLQPVG